MDEDGNPVTPEILEQRLLEGSIISEDFPEKDYPLYFFGFGSAVPLLSYYFKWKWYAFICLLVSLLVYYCTRPTSLSSQVVGYCFLTCYRLRPIPALFINVITLGITEAWNLASWKSRVMSGDLVISSRERAINSIVPSKRTPLMSTPLGTQGPYLHSQNDSTPPNTYNENAPFPPQGQQYVPSPTPPVNIAIPHPQQSQGNAHQYSPALYPSQPANTYPPPITRPFPSQYNTGPPQQSVMYSQPPLPSGYSPPQTPLNPPNHSPVYGTPPTPQMYGGGPPPPQNPLKLPHSYQHQMRQGSNFPMAPPPPRNNQWPPQPISPASYNQAQRPPQLQHLHQQQLQPHIHQRQQQQSLSFHPSPPPQNSTSSPLPTQMVYYPSENSSYPSNSAESQSSKPNAAKSQVLPNVEGDTVPEKSSVMKSEEGRISSSIVGAESNPHFVSENKE